MANYAIDKALHRRAVDQIFANLERKSWNSPAVKKIIAANTHSTAEQLFFQGWTTAHQLQDSEDRMKTPKHRDQVIDMFLRKGVDLATAVELVDRWVIGRKK